jgi:hypothetical protein
VVAKGRASVINQSASLRHGNLEAVSFINAPAGMPPPPKPKPNPIITLRKKHVLRATSLETSVVALREALSEATTAPELHGVLSSLGPSLLASVMLVQPDADRPPPSAPPPCATRCKTLQQLRQEMQAGS